LRPCGRRIFASHVHFSAASPLESDSKTIPLLACKKELSSLRVSAN
jgi:hypothetical protein